MNLNMKETYFLAIKWTCNTNCVFCNFYETKWSINEKEHFKEIKNEISKLSNKNIEIINIWINGYEPTVFKYFFEILDLIKRKKIKTKLFTNGVLLAKSDFSKRLSKYINEVSITLYSSNDREHNILTQNNDSYKLKHKAILNCLKYKIKVNLSILLLRPTLNSLSSIMNQIIYYFPNKYISNRIWLIPPNTVMWKSRNKILIPPHTSIVKWIRDLLKKYSSIFQKNNILLELNSTIPRCLFNFNNKQILFPKRNIKERNNKNNKTSFIVKKSLFNICTNCKFKNDCKWLEKDYIEIFWSSEVEKGKILDNDYSLDDINKFLIKRLQKYKNEFIWFNYSFLDKHVKEYKDIIILPRLILNYVIKDVLIFNKKIRKLRFINIINKDVFILNIKNNKEWKYQISLYKWNKKYIELYNSIIDILYKKLNHNNNA